MEDAQMGVLPNLTFSPDSLVCSDLQPGTIMLDSARQGWRSLLVQTMRCPTNIEAFETRTTPDQLIVVVTRGEFEIESVSGKSRRVARQTVGQGGMRMGGCGSRLRWTSEVADEMETTRIYVPTSLFELVTEEYRRIGAPSRLTQRDTLKFEDPVVASIARSLVLAARSGAPDIVAASAASFLVTHMLSHGSSWAAGVGRNRSAGNLSKQRIERVIDFMHQNLDQQISLDDLADEAGISRFHFISRFRKATGTTPYRYLLEMRVNSAAKLLSETEQHVSSIATACGFGNATHFSSAFRAHMGSTPLEYRNKHRRRRTRS